MKQADFIRPTMSINKGPNAMYAEIERMKDNPREAYEVIRKHHLKVDPLLLLDLYNRHFEMLDDCEETKALNFDDSASGKLYSIFLN